MAAAEVTYTVPEDALHMVKLQFEAKYSREGKHWALGKLIFDTVAQPVMAGVRSAGVNARQMVYEADGLTVDLRFDRQARSSKIFMVGQVIAKGTSQDLFRNITVILWSEKGEPILATKTTPFGEFQIEFERQDHLRLSIEASGRRPVRIPLENFEANGIVEHSWK